MREHEVLGIVGAGRMGAGLALRLADHGIRTVLYDQKAESAESVAAEDPTGHIRVARSLASMVRMLPGPRAVWVMVPQEVTDAVINDVAKHLDPDDTIIDGGNTHFARDIARARELEPLGIHYVDVGTSGGVLGRKRGFCLMIGGKPEPVEALTPFFRALAPGLNAAPRTPGRTGDPAPEEEGWLHCGPHGAGHFVKMFHNTGEYGIMAAYAEVFAMLANANAGLDPKRSTMMEHPEHYQYTLEPERIAELWRRGSILGGFLLDQTAELMLRLPDLDGYDKPVKDSGESRWGVRAAIDLGISPLVSSAALAQRLMTQDAGSSWIKKVLCGMRDQFGGHIKAETDQEQSSQG